MSPKAFVNLCTLLRDHGGLTHTRRASIEEQVAKFLHTVGHNVRNRVLSFFFRRSGETISRHFHRVLDALIELEEIFLKQPDGTQVPPEICNNNRFYPYFKDCIGAIDCTHIRVKVPTELAPRYRGRKDYPTQNVLAACTFDLKFTYVLVGWEGTASDSRIVKSALTRRYPLKVPQGKYYLADAGFPLKACLITPYRGERYHLQEYSRNPPQNPRELFNNRHSSLRMSIECAFGVLKKRFPILQTSTEPTFGIKTQNKIIVACCILHNYLMTEDPNQNLIDEVRHELTNESGLQEGHQAQRENNDDTARGELVRADVTGSMWIAY
ncbi:protein ALP1-like [Medicago truncatula]|uniref:protein ALP1-like n=1 Tax=Medicago truncatula TaxID=3880 RepID=UPI000D2F1AB0|nr:protein ALP1-like [Medicago truncatula]